MKKFFEVLQDSHPLGRDTKIALLELVQLPNPSDPFRIVPAEVARRLGVDSIDVARAIEILVRSEILERKDLDEGGFQYMYAKHIQELRNPPRLNN